MKNGLLQEIKNLFRYEGKIDVYLIILFLVINLIVLINAIWHHPKIGYDATSHLSYIQILSTGRFPKPADDAEYYSPPLPYFLPAIFDGFCDKATPGAPDASKKVYSGFECRLYDGKFAQFLNFLLSLGTTLILLMISEQIKPGNRFFKISIPLLLSVLTVYYKTFSQVRGEPYVVFFVMLSIYLINRIFTAESLNYKHVVSIGISLGLLVLCRQWGFFVIPGIILLVFWMFLQNRKIALKYGKIIMLSFLISAIVGGWFYIYLRFAYGTFTPFNLDSKGSLYQICRHCSFVQLA